LGVGGPEDGCDGTQIGAKKKTALGKGGKRTEGQAPSISNDLRHTEGKSAWAGKGKGGKKEGPRCLIISNTTKNAKKPSLGGKSKEEGTPSRARA